MESSTASAAEGTGSEGVEGGKERQEHGRNREIMVLRRVRTLLKSRCKKMCRGESQRVRRIQMLLKIQQQADIMHSSDWPVAQYLYPLYLQLGGHGSSLSQLKVHARNNMAGGNVFHIQRKHCFGDLGEFYVTKCKATIR